jgi:hypothetical protein
MNESIKDKYIVKSIDSYLCKEWFLKKHYAHRIPNSIYTFGLYDGNILQGVMSFGITANKNLNEFIKGYECIELNRLVVNEGLPLNTVSYFISQSLKLIPKPKVIISYADSEQGHHGYIYQATNFIYTGLSEGKRVYFKDGKEYHRKSAFDIGIKSIDDAIRLGFEYYKGKPKHRYIYLLGNKKQIKDMKLNLKFDIESYPKGENTRYDASYSPTIQANLF